MRSDLDIVGAYVPTLALWFVISLARLNRALPSSPAPARRGLPPPLRKNCFLSRLRNCRVSERIVLADLISCSVR